MSPDLPGRDLARLGPWLADHVGAGSELSARHISGARAELRRQAAPRAAVN